MRAPSKRCARGVDRVLKAIFVGLFAATCSVSSFADHFVVLSDSPLPERKEATPGLPEISYAGPSAKGGLVLAGRQGFYSSWAAHVSDDATFAWVSTLPQQWPGIGATAVADARDGGFWVVGHGRSMDTRAAENQASSGLGRLMVTEAASYDNLARLDKSGQMLWQRRLFEGHQRFAYCVREAPDGPIVLGFSRQTYRAASDKSKSDAVFVPWLTKFDPAGHMQWDRALIGEDVPALESPDLRDPSCTGLQISAKGQITVAVTVIEIDGATKTSEGVVLPARYWDHTSARGTLVVQLSSDGHVLHSSRTSNAYSAYLFAQGSGFSLVEHLRYKLDSGRLAGADLLHMMSAIFDNVKATGIRITRFDERLQTISTQEIKLPALADRVSAVLQARSGGYFVAGCDQSGFNSIVHITATGSIGAIERIKPSPSINQCDTFGLANGRNDGEVLVFYGGSLDRNNIARLKVVPDYVAASPVKGRTSPAP
ncbi:hypothetical protein [Paraburkholderia sp. GAS42]|jgi:hypothetical protein|uniref:hypothetical protein n=1 Tax=Paraburkholderia sp. GAS42 TaxID=3035135 RepID=UPI003D1A9459